MNISWKILARYFIVLVGITLIFLRLFHFNGNRINQNHPVRSVPQENQAIKNKPESTAPAQTSTPNKDIPEYVMKVLNHVTKYQEAPPGYVGGRIFENREQVLNEYDRTGNIIEYHEWDVHPKVKGENRGAERLITGSDHSAYYTANHYQTFIKIKL